MGDFGRRFDGLTYDCFVKVENSSNPNFKMSAPFLLEILKRISARSRALVVKIIFSVSDKTSPLICFEVRSKARKPQ